MNKVIEHKFNFNGIRITNREVANIIGYSFSEIPEMVNIQVDEIFSEIREFCDIKGAYQIVESVQIKRNHIQIEDRIFNTKRIISSALNHSNSLAIFVCTAGEKLSDWVAKTLKTDPVKGYIADIIASLIVEKATDKLQDLIGKQAQIENKNISNRYSPGYCGWDVSDQHQLFSFLPDNICGISLNDAALMHPIKSVSGIIGIGEDVKNQDYQCNKCEKKDCLLAKQKN